MHAIRIIQDLLDTQCQTMHAKRRACLARLAAAAQAGLGVVRMGRQLAANTALRHRIKCCDRLLSNPHLSGERLMVYRAMAERILPQDGRIGIVVDWSVLRDDGSAQLLRAAAVVQGRAITVYEEVHPRERIGSPIVQRHFMQAVRTIVPPGCRPIIITDAGFRAPWFHMLNELGLPWIGRIRNRDMVSTRSSRGWVGCKTLYAKAARQGRDLGPARYTRSNPVSCRLVLAKRPPKGRHARSKAGNVRGDSHHKKQSLGQREPWLLAVAPALAGLGVERVIAAYVGRMQIEQTFRDLKNPRWGMGLRHSQTRPLPRLANLLLIAALFTYALWLIGLAARNAGFNDDYGSRCKAPSTLSLLSLAAHWLTAPHRPALPAHAIRNTLPILRSLLPTYEI